MRTFRLFLLAALIAVSTGLAADDVSYIFRTDRDSTTMKGSLSDLEDVIRKYPDNFIWYRIGRTKYLIRDENVLAEARRAYAKVRELDPDREDIEARLRTVEKKEEALDREIDRLSDSDEGEHEPGASRLRELEAQMRVVRREMRPLEEEERRIDQKQEAVEKVAEAELDRIVRRAISAGKAQKLN